MAWRAASRFRSAVSRSAARLAANSDCWSASRCVSTATCCSASSRSARSASANSLRCASSAASGAVSRASSSVACSSRSEASSARVVSSSWPLRSSCARRVSSSAACALALSPWCCSASARSLSNRARRASSSPVWRPGGLGPGGVPRTRPAGPRRRCVPARSPTAAARLPPARRRTAAGRSGPAAAAPPRGWPTARPRTGCPTRGGPTPRPRREDRCDRSSPRWDRTRNRRSRRFETQPRPPVRSACGRLMQEAVDAAGQRVAAGARRGQRSSSPCRRRGASPLTRRVAAPLPAPGVRSLEGRLQELRVAHPHVHRAAARDARP